MNVALVYSDLDQVPSNVDAFVGSDRFGDIIFRRRAIRDWIAGLAEESGIEHVLLLRGTSDANDIRMAIQTKGIQRVLHLTAWLAPASEQFVRDCFRRLSLVRDVCHGSLRDPAVPLIAAPATEYLKLLPRLMHAEGALEAVDHISTAIVPLEGAFVDIRDPVGLIDLLSNSFAARHFNDVRSTRAYVVKRSTDVRKIRAEHDFYYLMPPEMRHWFVMPFGLEVDQTTASYRMERLLVLDMGQQWVNGSVTPADFERFLEDILRFLEQRTRKPCSTEQARRNFDNLYIDKVRSRLSELAARPVKNYLDAMLKHGTPFGSLDAMSAAYFDLISKYRRSTLPYECVSHGDCCFSNIIYEKRIRLLKLIDPKGAMDSDQLYSDPLYDYAKLSHSILGGYDFVVNEFYDITVRRDLKLILTTPDPNFETYAQQFSEALAGRDLDLRRIRLYEVSLFLSMLPLHVDAPRNLLAFSLIAAHILAELSAPP